MTTEPIIVHANPHFERQRQRQADARQRREALLGWFLLALMGAGFGIGFALGF